MRNGLDGGGVWFGHKIRLRRIVFFFLDHAVPIGNATAVDFNFLEHPPDVLMTGEHKQLVPLLGKFAQDRTSGFGTPRVEVYEDVVENHRQMNTTPTVCGDER